MAAGSIVVDLLMRTGAFETDTDRAGKRLLKLKKEAVDVGKAIGLAFAGASVAAAALVKSAIDSADAMTDMAQSTGLSVETLSALTYAADFGAVSQEALASSLVKLTKNMSDAAMGTGEAVKGFDALGISVTDADGKLKASDAVLAEVAAKFATFEDGAAKTALAVNLFGKSGAELIPMLNLGADGIEALKKEAAELGIVMSTDAANAAGDLNDTIARLQGVSQGLVNRIATELLPMLNNLAGQFLSSAKGAGALDEAARVAATGVKLLVSAGVVIGGVFKTIGQALGGLAATVVEFFSGNFRGAFETAKATSFDFVGNIKGTIGAVSSIWSDEAAKVDAGADANAKKLAAPVMKADEKVKTASKSIRDEAAKLYEAVEKQIGGIQREIATFGKDDAAVKLFDLQASGATPEQIERAKQYLETLKALNQIQKDGEAAAEKRAEIMREGAAVFEATRTPAEELAAEYDRLNKLLEAGAINWDTYSRAVFAAQDSFDAAEAAAKKTGEEMDDFAKKAAENIQSSLGDALYEGMNGNFKNIERSFTSMLQRLVAESIATDLTRSLFGGAAKGGSGDGWFGKALGSLGSLLGFGGARAGGGDVLPDRSYLVGEDGPERFVPRTAGTILPAQKAAAAGNSVNVVLNQTFAPGTDRRTVLQAAAEAQLALQRGARNL